MKRWSYLATLLALGCGSSGEASSGGYFASDDGTGTTTSSSGYGAAGGEWSSSSSGAGGGSPSFDAGTGGSGGSALPPPPPEEELESAFGAPVATGKYVWVANPASGRVAFINAQSFDIKVVEAGNAPKYLAAVPDPKADVAIVLNVLSKDAAVLRASGGGLSVKLLPVPAGGNSWAVSASGRWAIAWTDARGVEKPDPLDGYQDVQVLDLTQGAEQSTSLTVGYRPVSVSFDDTGARAFAVSSDGVTVIALDGKAPVTAKNVALDGPQDDPTAREVLITPDGAYALVRREASKVVRVHSLVAGGHVDVKLPTAVTDLDLSADGKVAVAVVPQVNLVALLPIPAIASNPDVFKTIKVEPTPMASAALAAQSPIGILYTNATPSPIIAVFDSSAQNPETRDILLKAPVKAVFPTPDAAHALVLHDVLQIQGGSKYPGALSVVPVAVELPPKITGFAAPLRAVALAPDGKRAILATGDADAQVFQMLVAAMPSLKIDVHQLASMPLAAGIVAQANQGYVAQEHPDGRITFVDLKTGQVHTITGFELAAQVIDGSGK